MNERALPALAGAGLVALLLLSLLGTVYGSTPLAMGQVVRALGGQLVAGLDRDVPLAVSRIVLDLRLPRVLLAACVGCGLASVGVLLQTTTRNDLADPFLFGLSSGATAGAVAVITMLGDQLGVWTLPVATFAGAALSATAVLSLVARHQDQGPERLIIAGLAVSFLFGALTSFMVFAGDQRAAYSILFWSVGGLGLASWGNVPLALLGAGLAVGTGLVCHWRLDALLAGDETAASLDIDVRRLRRLVFIMAALATACLVALSGVIGFVGLMVPHLARHRRRTASPAGADLGTARRDHAAGGRPRQPDDHGAAGTAGGRHHSGGGWCVRAGAGDAAGDLNAGRAPGGSADC